MVQLAATETTLEEQAHSNQKLDTDLAQCQEELQRASDARQALEVGRWLVPIEFIHSRTIRKFPVLFVGYQTQQRNISCTPLELD